MGLTKVKSKITFSVLVIIMALSSSYGQKDWGIGLRLGDPTGVTVKKYFEKSALEISVGRSHTFNGNRWYNNRVDDWYEEQNFNYRDFQYLRYKSSAAFGIQVHYLFRKSISKLAEENISGLEWYFGFGGQARHQRFTYDYRYKVEGNPSWIYATGDRINDYDIGTDGVIGLEYTFKDIPVSLFVDVTLFMELVDDPFLFSAQGGIGGRYNF